jgi:hypothetical protein
MMYNIKNSGQGKQPLKKPSHQPMNAPFGGSADLTVEA